MQKNCVTYSDLCYTYLYMHAGKNYQYETDKQKAQHQGWT